MKWCITACNNHFMVCVMIPQDSQSFTESEHENYYTLPCRVGFQNRSCFQWPSLAPCPPPPAIESWELSLYPIYWKVPITCFRGHRTGIGNLLYTTSMLGQRFGTRTFPISEVPPLPADMVQTIKQFWEVGSVYLLITPPKKLLTPDPGQVKIKIGLCTPQLCSKVGKAFKINYVFYTK